MRLPRRRGEGDGAVKGRSWLRALALAASFAAPAAAEEEDWNAMIERRRGEIDAAESAALPAALAWAGEAPGRRFAAKGVRADRDTGEVVLSAFTTSLQPGNIAEFALITFSSGHEYEALFQTTASADDIERALVFAGMAPGKPVSAPAFRFWPRGERVSISVSVEGGPERALEEYLADARHGNGPLPVEGFVHVGGLPGPGGTNLVDSSGPGSVVPSYNEPVTLFDVPRLAPQSDVYESVVASKRVPGQPLLPATFRFRPERRPAPLPPQRVRDVALRLEADGGLSMDGASSTPRAALEELRRMITADKLDPFVSFFWDGGATVADVRRAAELLLAAESANAGIRVDAPPEGFPYYKAFLPDDAWRDRANRYTQPCELRFAPDGAVSLVAISETWEGENLKPTLSAETVPLDAPGALPEALARHAPPDIKALLVFVPGEMKWSVVAPWLSACRATHPLVQIFPENNAQ